MLSRVLGGSRALGRKLFVAPNNLDTVPVSLLLYYFDIQ